MAFDTDIAVLAGAPLFSLLDPQPLRLLAFAAETRILQGGDVLFRKGDRSDGGYVVTDGAIMLDPGDGSPVFVAEPGAVIGQTAFFIRMTRPTTATARALGRDADFADDDAIGFGRAPIRRRRAP